MTKKQKKVSSYIEELFILTAADTGCGFIFAFSSLIGNPVGIGSFAVGLKIKMLPKNKTKYDPIVLLPTMQRYH